MSEPQASATGEDHEPARPAAVDVSDLPDYSRSLLKISLPVQVLLAAKKQKLQDVTELAQGTIIKFDKACHEMLQLYVGNQAVAAGEAVKIGDKFGFRVSTMLMPDENFAVLRKK